MKYYPLFLDISGKRCVVAGGGQVAERKICRLVACGAATEVVARLLTPRLERMSGAGEIVHRNMDYRREILPGAFLVIGATNDRAVNLQIAADARVLGIPANIVDAPEKCDFIVPSLLERGDLTIAVSTGGKSPALARKIRMELENLYGPEYALLLRMLGEFREKILARGEDSKENRELFDAVPYQEIVEYIRSEKLEEIEAVLQRVACTAKEERKG